MTDHQREVFTNFIKARKKSQINVQEPIWLALLLAREKPGVALSPISLPPWVDTDSPVTSEEVVKTFDLEYKIGERQIVYAARTSWLFNLLSSTGEYSARVRRTGCFFGYPPKAIDHFINNDPPDTSAESFVADGIFRPEEVAYTTYLPYRHDDSIAGYERAIEAGKRIRATVGDLATTWDIDYLNEYATHLYDEAVSEYSM